MSRHGHDGASNVCHSSSSFPGNHGNYHRHRTGSSGSSVTAHNTVNTNTANTSANRSSSFGASSVGVYSISDGLSTVSALTLLSRKRKRYESSWFVGSNHMNPNSCLIAASGQDNAATGKSHMIRLPPPLYLLLPPPSPTADTAPGNSSMVTTTTITNPSISQYAASSNVINTVPPTGGGVFEIGPGITEIAGEAGTGKTQLCLRLCVSCAMLTYTVGEISGDNGGSKGQNAVQSNGAASTNAWITPGPLRDLSEQQAMSNEYLHQYQKQPQQQRPYHQSLARNPYSQVPPSYYSRQERAITDDNSATPMLPPQDRMPHHQRQQEREQQTNPRQQDRHYYRAVYVTMGEGLTPAQIAYRLGQMASSTTSTSEYTQQQQQQRQHVPTILNRILTRSVRNEDELLDMIKRELPDMLQSGYDQQQKDDTAAGRIGLVVFDSIAGLFRTPDLAPAQTTETSTDKQRRDRTSFFARRSEVLFGVSSQLRRLSDEYGVAFVMANQATSTVARRAGSGGSSSTSSNTIPALGMSWSNCINSRFVLRRYESLGSRLGATSGVPARAAKGSNGGAPPPPPPVAAPPSRFKRWVRVVKSPVLPQVSVPFSIGMGGGVAEEVPK